jgi:hypothetical protein
VIDAPQSGGDNHQSDPHLEQTVASPETTNTTPPNNKQQQPKQNRKYPEYVMRPLKAVGQSVIAVVNWTDKNDGFITALATVVIAVLTGIYVHYSRAQWKVMRDQLTEMTNSRLQAKTDSASAITAQQAIAQTSLSTSQGNFDKSSQSAENTFRDEQRAWIGVTRQTLEQFEEKKAVVIGVSITNAGKTPARNLKIRVRTIVTNYPINGPAQEDIAGLRKAPWILGPAMSPQGQYSITIGKDQLVGQILTEENKRIVQGTIDRFPLIKSKTLFLYDVGEVSYEDVSRRTHLTTFCVFLADPETKFVAFCPEFNEIE